MKRRAPSKTARRVTAYVDATFGTVTAAALALGVERTTLWRAMRDRSKHPSAKLILALADHSKQSTDYWYGRTDT